MLVTERKLYSRAELDKYLILLTTVQVCIQIRGPATPLSRRTSSHDMSHDTEIGHYNVKVNDQKVLPVYCSPITSNDSIKGNLDRHFRFCSSRSFSEFIFSVDLYHTVTYQCNCTGLRDRVTLLWFWKSELLTYIYLRLWCICYNLLIKGP